VTLVALAPTVAMRLGVSTRTPALSMRPEM
jgi:hypothetical protein